MSETIHVEALVAIVCEKCGSNPTDDFKVADPKTFKCVKCGGTEYTYRLLSSERLPGATSC